jgi:hypothetical protein
MCDETRHAATTSLVRGHRESSKDPVVEHKGIVERAGVFSSQPARHDELTVWDKPGTAFDRCSTQQKH